MATPTPNDPKKPAAHPPAKPATPPAVAGPKPVAPPAAAGAKPGVPYAGRPVTPPAGPTKPPIPGATGAPGVRPPVTGPAAKPPVAANPAARPGVPQQQRPAVPSKPAAPKPTKPRYDHIDSATRQLGAKLVELAMIDEGTLDSLYEEMRALEGVTFTDVLNSRGAVTKPQLLKATADVFGMTTSTLEDAKPSAEAVKLVPLNMAELYKLCPISFENDTLTVAMGDPNSIQSLEEIRTFLGVRNVTAVLAPPEAVESTRSTAYAGNPEESVASLISQLESDGKLGKKGMMKRETSIDLDDLTEMAHSAPVRKLINMVLLMAIRDRASDIHFEPFEDEYKMRYKCDGVLYEMVPPPRHLANAIASRIKVMSNLDIAERRMPQDGRIELNVGGNRIDMRVSILPTMFGESTVIRVLDKSSVGLSLDKIGMPPQLLSDFRKVIRKPNGIVLVTGPTGSGKTTTLYSALSELNDIETKIITTEDPVEYEIDGLVQVPIDANIEVTFASALRAILRQDPDVILVGEMRDLETAQIGIQASLTGHLVFSTLHTNDAPSSVTRLRDMGVEPFLITATVEAIQAQRLVRRVCQNCKTPYDPTRDQLLELNLPADALKGRKFFYGEGCSKCNNLGFKGRTGLYELMIINDDIRDLISRGGSTDQLRQYTRKGGAQGLRDAGIQALYEGMTSLDEVVRETVMEDEA